MPYYGYYGFDPMYLLFVLPALILSMLAQGWVKGSYHKYSAVPNMRRMTGRDAAEAVCRRARTTRAWSFLPAGPLATTTIRGRTLSGCRKKSTMGIP